MNIISNDHSWHSLGRGVNEVPYMSWCKADVIYDISDEDDRLVKKYYSGENTALLDKAQGLFEEWLYKDFPTADRITREVFWNKQGTKILVKYIASYNIGEKGMVNRLIDEGKIDSEKLKELEACNLMEQLRHRMFSNRILERDKEILEELID